MPHVSYRRERIERLLDELRHEVTRGMMEREIDEGLGFEFFVPVSRHFPHGVVHCSFRTRPLPQPHGASFAPPRLMVVKGEGARE